MEKLDRVMKLLEMLDLQGWLIACVEDSDIHSAYLLGIRAHSRHFLLIDAGGNHVILATRMEASMIENATTGWSGTVKVLAPGSYKEMNERLEKLLHGKKIALNYGEKSFHGDTAFADYLRAGQLQSLHEIAPTCQFVSSKELLFNLRASKTKGEHKALEKAVKITIEVLESLPSKVKLGMSEKEVQALIHYEYMKIGEPSFETIVASGYNSADPHHNSTGKKIKKGPLLVDTGIRVDGISSDITWTYYMGGEPPEPFTRAYNALLEAKNVARQYMKAGECTRIPSIKCREKLASLDYDHETLFIHTLGHPLGYEVHDIGTRMSRTAPEDSRFPEGAIYTCEPGLYWQSKYGIRLEDDLIIHEDGPRRISEVPGDPIII
ncbi:M24 family metallopeptidase [Candidatus Bathyarchaeota archaeon]|nr:M24 family metallopeptidase [Candidatus Bathyarchaeota archaeon]